MSPGCQHCYAETLVTGRMGKLDAWAGAHHRTKTRTPIQLQRAAEKDGVRKRMFVASLADIFEDPTDPTERANLAEWRADAFGLVDRTPLVDWQLLTKRPENVLRMVPDGWLDAWPANVWVGTTVEDCKEPRLQRVRDLLVVPAPVRFISAEPLIQDNANRLDRDGILDGIDWVIVGGESGPGVRPMHPEWVRSWRNVCSARGIALFEKQWGAWRPRPTSMGRPLKPAPGLIALSVRGTTAFTKDNPFDPIAAGHEGWALMWRQARSMEHEPLALDGYSVADFPTPKDRR